MFDKPGLLMFVQLLISQNSEQYDALENISIFALSRLHISMMMNRLSLYLNIY